MSALAVISRIAVTIVVVGGAFALLPDAAVGSSTFTIPDPIWNPVLAVLGLNRYLPIAALLAVAVFEVTIRGALFAAFLGSWVWKRISVG